MPFGRSTPQPTVETSEYGPVVVVSEDLTDILPTLPKSEQDAIIDTLHSFIEEVKEHGNTWEYYKSVDITIHPGFTVPDIQGQVVDTLNWTMAKFLRYTTPTRITEAKPYLEEVIAYYEAHKAPNNKGPDITPILYLSVSLAKTPNREEDALRMFNEVSRVPGAEQQFHTMLWARSCMSRLLRKMGRDEEAENLELAVRRWIQGHPYGMRPSELAELVSDPEYEGEDHILGHPDIRLQFGRVIELPNTGSGLFGGMMIHFG